MLIYQALFTHILSQLTGRWMPVTEDSKNFRESGSDLDLSVGEWKSLIEFLYRTGSKADPWKIVFRRKLDLSYKVLAEAIFNHLQAIFSVNGRYLTVVEAEFPESLRHIPDYPAGISVIGDSRFFQKHCVGMVGSRKASQHAAKETRKLATWLADQGLIIASGGAYGCDLIAHRAALESGIRPAPTIVVTADGFEFLDKTGKRGVFRELLGGGAMFVSERLYWAPSRPRDFLSRNRIITGLSQEVFVMQAGLRSGTSHLASMALKQGRDLAVLQHQQEDIRAAGSRHLLADGAIPFVSAEQFLCVQDRLWNP